MAVPQRRTSKTRKRKRRTHLKLTVPGMHTCSNPECEALIPAHKACPSCGQYKGRQVVKLKEAASE